MGGAKLQGRRLGRLLCAAEAGGCLLVEQPCVVNFCCEELPKAATEGLPSAAVSKLQPLHRLIPEPPAERGRERASDKVKQLRKAASSARAS